jgi:membrane-associated protein
VCGGIGWVSAMTVLGYELGSIVWVRKNFEKVVVLIILISLLPTAIEVLRSRRSGTEVPRRMKSAPRS